MNGAERGVSAMFFIAAGGLAVALALLAFLLFATARSAARFRRTLESASLALLSLAGLCAALALAEGLMRILVPGGYFKAAPREASTPEALVEQLPDGQAYWEYRNARDFDANGFRGGAPLPPDPGKLRIALLGDSVSYGVYVPLEDTFATLLARRLDAQCDGVSLYNVAVPAYSTIQERISLERKVLAARPDIVLVGALPNDIEAYTFVGNAAFDVRVEQQEGVPVFRHFPLPDSVNRFLLVHSVLYQFLTFRGLSASDDASGRRRGQLDASLGELEKIRSLCAEAGARVAVILFPMLDTELSRPEEEGSVNNYELFRRIRSWAAAHEVDTIDVRTLLASHPLASLAYDTCCHYSVDGHKLVAEALENALYDQHILPARCSR
jgi:hypothetical protein